jgi:hypothetical protein
MTDTKHAATSDALNDLINLASRETMQRHEARTVEAALPPPRARFSRERVCFMSLLITAPILAVAIATNVLGYSLVDMVTPAPAPEIARQLVQETMQGVVREIESFRHDYSELPDMLSEVGVPARGTWTYEKKPGGQYIVTGEMYGQIVRYGAPARKAGLDDRAW